MPGPASKSRTQIDALDSDASAREASRGAAWTEEATSIIKVKGQEFTIVMNRKGGMEQPCCSTSSIQKEEVRDQRLFRPALPMPPTHLAGD